MLENGIPKSVLQRGDNFGTLQSLYGNFASTALVRVKHLDRNAPLDVVTFGENWFQLVENFDAPRDKRERVAAGAMGAEIFADIWPIMERRNGMGIDGLMDMIQRGVHSGSLQERILRSFVILDLAQTPPLTRDQLKNRFDTPWGENGTYSPTKTFIYHITSGYTRSTQLDLHTDQ